MKISTFIFDLDGTLTDPLPGMAGSLNHALAEHGFGQRDEQEFARYVGPPLEETLSQLTASEDSNLISALVASYRERYLQQGYAQNSVYPGIQSMLDRLQQNGRRMAVCTSKTVVAANKILQLFALDHYFDFVSGGDIGVKKWQQLEALLAQGQIDHDAVMIGDRRVDISAARRNHLRNAGVTWGYGSERELQQAQPDFLFTGPQDISSLIECGA